VGTWGPGPFDNDAASDLLARLTDASTLREALDEAVAADGFVDYDIAAAAIAAAAIVAYATGRLGTDALPSVVPDGLSVPDDLLALAVAALDQAVSEASEWRMLWADSGDVTDALSEVNTIRQALQS
jgi:hypothetical protein